jgi:hypothetical protein
VFPELLVIVAALLIDGGAGTEMKILLKIAKSG